MIFAQKYSQLLQRLYVTYTQKYLQTKQTKLLETNPGTNYASASTSISVSTVPSCHYTISTVTQARTLVQSSVFPNRYWSHDTRCQTVGQLQKVSLYTKKTVSFGGGQIDRYQVKLIKLLITPQRYRGRIPSQFTLQTEFPR